LTASIIEDITSLLECLHIDNIADHITLYTSKATPLQHIPTELMLFYIITVVS